MRVSRRPFLLATTGALALTLAGGLALAAGRPAGAPTAAPAGAPTTADAPLPAPVSPLTPIVVGPADPAATVSLTLALRGRDPDGLARAVAALGGQPATGSSVVTPAAFGDRYGLPLADEDQLVATLTADGLTVTARVPQRTTLGVSGRVADVERVFGVTLEQLQDPATGAGYIAAVTTPAVPAAFAASVTGILGLDRSRAISAIRLEDAPEPPGRGLAPADLALAYGYDRMWANGFQGQGENVAILQLGKDTDEDLAVFDQAFDIQGPPPARIPVGDGVQNAPPDFASEASLDTQVIRAVAPKAQILVYGFPTTTTFAQAMDAIVADGRAKIVSLSYGQCDVNLPDIAEIASQPSFAAAALAGVTLFAASGDWGAFTCHVFDPTNHEPSTFWPACEDNLVSVGGTFLETRQDGSYLRETGWESYLTTGGGGGGLSQTAPRPAWQTGPGVENGTSNGNRQCPDVAAVADEDSGYVIFYTDPSTGEAGWHQMGGTSAAAPLWAGMATLMQQEAHQEGLGDYGFLAPRLYRVWQNEPGVFHDVVRGGNLLEDATEGWDYSTGIGTPIAADLSQALMRDLQANP